MSIQIHSRTQHLNEDLRCYIQRRFDFALSQRYEQIKRILVTLSDINGPKGGEDKRCQVIIQLAKQDDIVIEDIQSDFYIAVDRAASRSSRALSRCLEKARQKSLRYGLAI